MHQAFYCSLMYKNKKVKSFQEGFLTRNGPKIVLLNERKELVDSIFSKAEIAEDEEYLMESMYVLCGELVDKPIDAGVTAAPMQQIIPKPLNRKRLAVTIRKPAAQETNYSAKKFRLSVSDVDNKPSSSKRTENSSGRPTSSKSQTVAKPSTKPSKPKTYLCLDTKKMEDAMKSNLYGLFFEKQQGYGKLYRRQIIPVNFADVQAYQKAIQQCLAETLNIDLSKLANQYFKGIQEFGQTNGRSRDTLVAYLRQKGVSYYESLTMRDSQGGNTNVLLELNSKQHHSAYSKDDVWILAEKSDFRNCQFFRSFYFGPSSSHLELIPLMQDKRVYVSWIDNCTELCGINSINAVSEIAAFDILNDLVEMPLSKYVLEPSKGQFHESTLVMKNSKMIFTNIVDNAAEEFQLNIDQRRVVHSFVGSLYHEKEPITLVHGVYGSGKSTLLSVLIIILYRALNVGLLESDTKIVVSSLTNVAVDGILNSLLKKGFDDIVRVGSTKKIAKAVLPYLTHNMNESQTLKDLNEMLDGDLISDQERRDITIAIKNLQNQENQLLIQEAFVLGITTSSCSFEIVQNLERAILILDECSQMTEPCSLIPIARFKAQYAILVGDPKQLGPTLTANLVPDLKPQCGLERTVFERLANWQEPIMLRTQYRCHPSIAKITNHCFYNNQIINGNSTNGSIISEISPVVYVDTTTNESQVSGGSFENTGEIKLITSIVEQLVKKGISKTEIGVISLYKAQAYKIQHLLRSNGHGSVTSASVDSFQGAEKDVIILSTVRTSRTEFLEEPRRLNVALSRSKRNLFILANENMTRDSNLWSEIRNLCKGNIYQHNEILFILQGG